MFFSAVLSVAAETTNADAFQDMFDTAINIFRKNNYLNCLKPNHDLFYLAEMYQRETIKQNKFEHLLVENDWHKNILVSRQAGICYIYELLQSGHNRNVYPEEIIWKFSQSPDHNTSLLDKNLDFYGYSLDRVKGGYYFVLYLGEGLYE